MKREKSDCLHLVLKAKWFDMILTGEKKEEYREIKDYWTKRLYGHLLRYVVFHRGYTDNIMIFKIDTITAGYGNPYWGAPLTRTVYIIKLGMRV